MTIPAAVELSLAIIGGLTVLSFLFVVALIISDRRAHRRANRRAAVSRHPACASHDWDAALAALIENDTPKENH